MNNPSAFPLSQQINAITGEIYQYAELGMSLRDYFAGTAIALFPLDRERLRQGKDPEHELVAAFCYQLADAMLAARSRAENATLNQAF